MAWKDNKEKAFKADQIALIKRQKGRKYRAYRERRLKKINAATA